MDITYYSKERLASTIQPIEIKKQHYAVEDFELALEIISYVNF
ncbi:hypothetical protein [Methylacidiphilum kamchatkense]|uniref:Uncharacterized protein n=1 Tax=Methylacidiphilum kamchatkense Kam1 TaxID=1202785 RepID=A0A516TLM3_9BACT|nr:hypothetical protein [Methylacidiphilum kamchatkense]QDQ42084.1 hypothetical protein kam1_841 [Methylacidiphilum kamchatkense Kam1]